MSRIFHFLHFCFVTIKMDLSSWEEIGVGNACVLLAKSDGEVFEVGLYDHIEKENDKLKRLEERDYYPDPNETTIGKIELDSDKDIIFQKCPIIEDIWRNSNTYGERENIIPGYPKLYYIKTSIIPGKNLYDYFEDFKTINSKYYTNESGTDGSRRVITTEEWSDLVISFSNLCN